MFSIKSVYITVPHETLDTILCVLTSMVHVAPRQITAQYQMQISLKIHAMLTELQILQLNKIIFHKNVV